MATVTTKNLPSREERREIGKKARAFKTGSVDLWIVGALDHWIVGFH